MAVACQERILLVENDEDVAVVLKARLEAAGYDVHVEGFGSAALGYAATQLVDLVILDIQLPDLSGYEVCQELRQLCPRSDIALSILVFSGSQGPQGTVDEISAMASGADAYLTKRCEPNELMSLIEQLLHQSELTPTARF